MITFSQLIAFLLLIMLRGLDRWSFDIGQWS